MSAYLPYIQYRSGNKLPCFVFATMTSYSFHWYLTPDVSGPSPRFDWVDKNKKILLFF
ncbi:MAG: hypothetical protein R2942_02705 [Ignavibacteria bacterium]